MTPSRIQRKRTAGWTMPEGAVYVGRPTKWGNPFNFSSSDNCWNALALGCRGDRKGRQEASVKAFRLWISDPRGRVKEFEFGVVIEAGDKKVPIGPRAKAGTAPSLTEIQEAMRGKDLVCWCPLVDKDGKPVPCHADVLLELANK